MINGLIFIFTALLVFLYSSDVLAWGPITHLKLGLALIDNLSILPMEVARIISSNTNQFLYGCISADIIQAKRLLTYVWNCHNWENGFKLLRSAKSDKLKAFSFGYLGHLAADIIAHNCFIPAKIVQTYSRRRLKHFLWELRFDSVMYDSETKSVLKDIIKEDHEKEDKLMNDLLKTAIFSFRTNKRIFSSLLFIQRVKRWQASLEDVYTRNNYSLSKNEIDGYFRLSLDAILGFLIDNRGSKYVRFDPTGKKALRDAEKIAKELKRIEESAEAEQSVDIDKRVKHETENFLQRIA